MHICIPSADKSCIHDWPTTYKIIKGTCEGIHYLHKGRGEKNYIYHLDLKPENILLDENMVPKITDFGLSRLFGEEQTRINTINVVGKKVSPITFWHSLFIVS